MRVRNERPQSYHQMSSDNYHDIDDMTRFERSTNYATIRHPAPTDRHLNDDLHYLSRQFVEQQHQVNPNVVHEPRSRAPIPYDPYRYQERGLDYPRYQPHLQTAKFLSRLAIQEQMYLNKRMKSQYLKESSV